MRRSENDRREEVEGTECQKEKDMGEGRRDILPDKQRRRRDVCYAEEMLRKFFFKKGRECTVCCYICVRAGRSATVNRERGMMRQRERGGQSCFLLGRRQDVNT